MHKDAAAHQRERMEVGAVANASTAIAMQRTQRAGTPIARAMAPERFAAGHGQLDHCDQAAAQQRSRRDKADRQSFKFPATTQDRRMRGPAARGTKASSTGPGQAARTHRGREGAVGPRRASASRGRVPKRRTLVARLDEQLIWLRSPDAAGVGTILAARSARPKRYNDPFDATAFAPLGRRLDREEVSLQTLARLPLVSPAPATRPRRRRLCSSPDLTIVRIRAQSCAAG